MRSTVRRVDVLEAWAFGATNTEPGSQACKFPALRASIGAEMKRQHRGAALERAIAKWIEEHDK
jgi:hypothetical protein